eukprot:scaffold3169_cov117-Skeletonema_dohrnii-CCMP3373.AAC.1
MNSYFELYLYVPIGEKSASNDGDIIQFASGLDVHGSAVMTISMEKLHKMLVEVEVEPGQEVADLMRKIKSEE